LPLPEAGAATMKLIARKPVAALPVTAILAE
jgi:hypothetical protein